MCYTYSLRFEWDPVKAASNSRKHGVTFAEASECFSDPLAIVLDDSQHPERLILIGSSRSSRLIFTVYVDVSAALIRIVSARKASARERRAYEEEQE